jgi:hypothetical protein
MAEAEEDQGEESSLGESHPRSTTVEGIKPRRSGAEGGLVQRRALSSLSCHPQKPITSTWSECHGCKGETGPKELVGIEGRTARKRSRRQMHGYAHEFGRDGVPS